MRYARIWKLTVIVATAGGLSLTGAGAALAARGAAAAAPAVTIGTSSAFVQVTGDTVVRYGGAAREAQATVSGSVTGLPAGATSVTATLLSRPFGATSPRASGTPAALTPGAGGSAAYSFPVRPSLATSYAVQVSVAGSPVATSPARTVYVIAQETVTGAAACSRPTCSMTLTITARVPAAAFAVETTKSLFLYRGVRLSPAAAPSPPAKLALATTSAGPTAAGTAVGAGGPATPSTVRYSVSFRFRVGASGYRWKVNYCTQDSEARDGIGLPGHHGCGDRTVGAAAPYLG